MLLVVAVNGTSLIVVHPHTSDQAGDFGDDGGPVTDLWYGTTEPLSRVGPGEELIIYDPVDFREMGRVTTRTAAVLLSPATAQNSTLNQQADALYNSLAGAHHRGGAHCEPSSPQPCVPYNWGRLNSVKLPFHDPITPFKSSVYSIELETPPPPQDRPGAMAAVPYVVQIAKTQAVGTVVRDSLFEDSTGFFGRWKSSHSQLTNNTFRDTQTPMLEVQFLPSFFEGPIKVDNMTITNNSFEVGAGQGNATLLDLLELGPQCCKTTGLTLARNVLVAN